MRLTSIVLILVLIMNPVGSISSFTVNLQAVTTKRKSIVIIREMLIALGLMILFSLIGEEIFKFLQVQESTVRLASGVILFLGGLRILFPPENEQKPTAPVEEPFIVPLAIPNIAGPALLATIMLFSHIMPGITTMIFAILVAWGVSFSIVLSSNFLTRVLGSAGLMASERLVGMLLVMLAIQRFMDGVQTFIASVSG